MPTALCRPTAEWSQLLVARGRDLAGRSRIGHPGSLSHALGRSRSAVGDPQGHVQDAKQTGLRSDGGAECFNFGTSGGILEQAAQDIPGPARHVDGLDDHAVADRAQPGALASQQLGGAGRPDAIDRRQGIPVQQDAGLPAEAR